MSRALRLDDFGHNGHLGIIVGNTRALWPHFMAAMRRSSALRSSEHPLNRYTEHCVGEAAAALQVETSIRWSHDTGDKLVAMQRLAEVAGLAHVSQSHLCVHAEYGPWLGLRAALSVRLEGPSGEPPRLVDPCGGCEGRCLPALNKARASIGPGAGDTLSESATWRLWLACRDACPVGRSHRYSEAQINYHYVKDRVQLAQAYAPSAGAEPCTEREGTDKD